MYIDKNYPALLSVVSNVQSCKIASVESESDNLKGCVLDSVFFFIDVKFFFPK